MQASALEISFKIDSEYKLKTFMITNLSLGSLATESGSLRRESATTDVDGGVSKTLGEDFTTDEARTTCDDELHIVVDLNPILHKGKIK